MDAEVQRLEMNERIMLEQRERAEVQTEMSKPSRLFVVFSCHPSILY